MEEQTGASIETLVERAFADEDITTDRIPEIDLYMDQIITIFDENLKANKRRPEDKLLTKTMINNYSKEGVIKPVKGKKYTREHIIQMLMVYSMKNTLTIGEIKAVLQGVYRQPEFTAEGLEKCYERYLTVKEAERSALPEIVERLLRECMPQGETPGDLLVFLLVMSSLSTYARKIVEQMVDTYFLSDP